MTFQAFAPWLTSALAAALGLRPAEVSPAPDAARRVDAGLLPTLAALERWQPGLLPAELAARASAAAVAARASTAAVLAAVESVAPAIAERRVDWAALGPVDLVLRLGLTPEWVALTEAEALAAAFEVGRARLVTAARGLGGGGRTRLEFVTRLAPPGWPSLPLGPFLEGASPGREGAVPLMSAGASWAAHLVRAGRAFVAPDTVGALELAEAALRGLLVDSDERAAWDERLARWRMGRLWRRAREMEGWLVGGARPPALEPAVGEPGTASSTSRIARLRTGLRLQDGPLPALRYLVMMVARRRHDAE